MTPSPWLNSKEAAAYLGRKSRNSWKWIHQLAREGKVKAGYDGKSWKFKSEDLDAFLYVCGKGEQVHG